MGDSAAPTAELSREYLQHLLRNSSSCPKEIPPWVSRNSLQEYHGNFARDFLRDFPGLLPRSPRSWLQALPGSFLNIYKRIPQLFTTTFLARQQTRNLKAFLYSIRASLGILQRISTETAPGFFRALFQDDSKNSFKISSEILPVYLFYEKLSNILPGTTWFTRELT